MYKKIMVIIAFVFFSHDTFSQTFAIVAGGLIDGKSNEIKKNPTIIINKNKITDINFTNTIPDSAIVINLKEYTVLPGMMDMHTHVMADGRDYDKDLYNNSPSLRALRASKYLSIALTNGFTTIRDVCTEGAGYTDVDLRKAMDSGFIEGPTIFASGKGIAATGWYVPLPYFQNWEISLPSGTQHVTGTDECVKAVREQASHGVNWIKMFADWFTPTLNYDEMKAIVDEAKKYHINVAAHATTPGGIRMAILAGVKSIEHGDLFNDSLIDLAIAHHVYWSPTISVYEYNQVPVLDSMYKYLNRAYKRKLKIVLGTDIGSFPWQENEAKELEYYVKKAGLTPMDAIKTATLNPAELLGKENQLGQLAKNFTANIIAVKGDPLDDISLLQHVAFVMKDGKIIKQPVKKD